MSQAEIPMRIGRRRALRLLATAGAALACGAGSQAAPAPRRWRGTALGAPAELLFAGAGRSDADRAVEVCLDEIERLEREFSLFLPYSALSRLNRDGVLRRPSGDMRALLHLCLWLGEHSGGAFDISVQPLWQLYARHFGGAPVPDGGPPSAALQAVHRRVDYRRITLSDDRVRLPDGVALTLNGIAQGYITDRVADRLRALGWRHVLVQLGELRALDGRTAERPWSVDTPAGPVAIADRAVAVSAPEGSLFEPRGRYHHLLDPISGLPCRAYRSVTVVADRATMADGLSTALTAMTPATARRLLARCPGTTAHFVTASGARFTIGG